MTYKDSTGYKQNNYGNIRGNGIPYHGKTGMNKGFSVFESPEYGVRAIYVDLISKIKKGVNTIDKIINMYAPPKENNTILYVNNVVKSTGIPKDKVLTADLSEIRKIVSAIINHEIGYKITGAELLKSESLINQKKKPKAIITT